MPDLAGQARTYFKNCGSCNAYQQVVVGPVLTDLSSYNLEGLDARASVYAVYIANQTKANDTHSQINHREMDGTKYNNVMLHMDGKFLILYEYVNE